MTLKERTFNSLLWSFVDSFASQGLQFIISIILARLLSPREFGLIGMLTIFIAISQSLVESGFGGALIRKKECSQIDYSTVFYYNLIVSIIIFVILYISAFHISLFFKEPQLENILKVLGLGLIINGIGIIQRTKLTKDLNFKLQAKIAVTASIISGVLAIIMALNQYGVWSLVALTLSKYLINTILLWFWTKWKPSITFSFYSFKQMFGFGSNLLLTGLINTIFQHIYYIVIGKYYSATTLGFYTKADQLKSIPSENLNIIIGRVSFPVLSKLQDDKVQLKVAYKRLIKSVMFLTFILMLGLLATAKSFILFILGNKWYDSIQYLQLLCFVGIFYPINALNLNILKVLGRSDLILKLVLLGKLLIIPVVIIGILYGINIMIICMLIYTLINYIINSFISGNYINYSIKEQIFDILPSLFIAIIINLIVYLIGSIPNINVGILFIIQIFTGAIFTFFLCELVKLEEYIYIKRLFLGKFLSNT